ncbi:MAG TPA: response regulator [Candidatus Hydrogenedens sp.]|nr:response regulator [Candidatus Hydrogenedens sp.]
MSINILIVDDSSTVRAIIEKTLRISGIEIGNILHAGNGNEALEVLRKNWVDLVITDINMPVMNGVELINKMSQDELLKTIPIAIVSTEGSQTRVEELKSKGVKAYLRKPFTPESLKKLVIDLLGVSEDESNR